jgi:hypothetical protein
MKTFRIVLGLIALLNGLRLLLHGDWFGCVEFGAIGWSLLLDPTDKRTARPRLRLALVALACALLRYLI